MAKCIRHLFKNQPATSDGSPQWPTSTLLFPKPWKPTIFCWVTIHQKVGAFDIPGNPKSLSRFLPEKFIRKLPSQAETSLERSNSENSSLSNGSSFQGDFSIRTNSQTSGQGSGSDKRVGFRDSVITTSATTTSAPSNTNLNLDALDALQKSGAIEVIYPTSWQKN